MTVMTVGYGSLSYIMDEAITDIVFAPVDSDSMVSRQISLFG